MSNFDVEKIVVPDGGGCGNNFLAGMLASACQSKGIDLASVMALCNNGNRNGGLGGFSLDGIIALIVVAAIFGGNGNGLFGGNNNNQNSQMLMDALQRNGVSISELASTLNCSVGQIQTAIQNVASSVCQVENAVNLSGQQIINAVSSGNTNIIQQLMNCCCDIKGSIKDQTIALQNDLNFVNRSVERGFADLGYATRDQTCSIEKAIQASTEQVLAGQRAAEMREMQRELAERDRKISEQAVVINNGQQTAVFSNMITQATAPIAAALSALNTEIAGIKCHLPETKIVPSGDSYVKVNTGLNIPLQVSPAVFGGYGAFGTFSNNGNGGWG